MTNYGEGRGHKTGGGGPVKFYAYEKGTGKSFSHAEGGGGDAEKVCSSFSAEA